MTSLFILIEPKMMSIPFCNSMEQTPSYPCVFSNSTSRIKQLRGQKTILWLVKTLSFLPWLLVFLLYSMFFSAGPSRGTKCYTIRRSFLLEQLDSRPVISEVTSGIIVFSGASKSTTVVWYHLGRALLSFIPIRKCSTPFTMRKI